MSEAMYRSNFLLFVGIEQRGAQLRISDNEDYGERSHTYATEDEASAAYERLCATLRAAQDALVADGWEWEA